MSACMVDWILELWRYTGGTWQLVSGTTDGTHPWYLCMAIGANDTPYVAFNGASCLLYKFIEGTGLQAVGPFWYSDINYQQTLSLAVDRSGVAYLLAAGAGVSKYPVGGTGEGVGHEFATLTTTGYENSIAIDSTGTPYVVFSDLSNGGRATVMRLDTTKDAVANMAGVAASALAVYPNPAQGAFTVNLSAATNTDVHITITDVTGATVMALDTKTNTVYHHPAPSPRRYLFHQCRYRGR